MNRGSVALKPSGFVESISLSVKQFKNYPFVDHFQMNHFSQVNVLKAWAKQRIIHAYLNSKRELLWANILIKVEF